MTTMSTVGYGDISAQTDNEKAFRRVIAPAIVGGVSVAVLLLFWW